MREVDLRSRRFHASKNHHAPEGTAEHDAVWRVVAELHDDRLPLPGAGDVETSLPPRFPCMGRPIAGGRLLVCYVARGNVVYVVGVKPA